MKGGAGMKKNKGIRFQLIRALLVLLALIMLLPMLQTFL